MGTFRYFGCVFAVSPRLLPRDCTYILYVVCTVCTVWFRKCPGRIKLGWAACRPVLHMSDDEVGLGSACSVDGYMHNCDAWHACSLA